MLNKAAQNQENEIDHYTTKLVNTFEPIMILIMGGVVLFIVLAMLLRKLRIFVVFGSFINVV
jgi:general secretion pathway protein F